MAQKRERKTHSVRLTPYVWGQLYKAYEEVRAEIKERPHLYPAYSGRLLTMGDVILILLQRQGVCQ